VIYYLFRLYITDSEPAQHASKSQEPDTELDAPPDDDDEEVDQLADDDDDDDYKQDEELKIYGRCCPSNEDRQSCAGAKGRRRR
jgi:hypothetical protein